MTLNDFKQNETKLREIERKHFYLKVLMVLKMLLKIYYGDFGEEEH